MTNAGLIRAFLSHASEDKLFVEAVAQKLGRQYCLFDKFEFASGVEFKSAIDQALAQSGIFVLFVSKKSLAKFWVGYEMDEAAALAVRGALNRILVYIIDHDVSIEDIPKEFKKAKIEISLTASQVARDIVMHSEDLLRQRGGRYYMGRGSDGDAFSKLLLRRIAGRSPHIFFIAGLPGIGRREFLKRTARDSLSLRKHVEIRAAEGSTHADVLIQLKDALGVLVSYDALVSEAARVRSLERSKVVSEIVEGLLALTQASELPIIVDEGGVLLNDGGLEEWLRDVVGAVKGRADLYLAVVSNRKPLEADDPDMVFYRLKPISDDATKLLIAKYAEDYELTLSEAQLDEFARYIAGYPPAIGFAVQQAKEYGVDLLIASKERLVEFRRKFFFDYIDRMRIEKQSPQVAVIRVLSYFSPLPLSALGYCIDLGGEDLVDAVTKLIDMSLIIVDDGLYRISDPVAEAATKNFGLPSPEVARKLSVSLRAHLEDTDVDSRRLDVSRALFRAARLSGDDSMAEHAVRLTSDLVGLVEQLYHRRRYEEAVKAGVLAFEEAPKAVVALGYLVRALVQLEKWERAEQYLNNYKRIALVRDWLFLRAFMAKRKGEHREAIALYEQSRAAGRTGVSISRELSQCCVLVGDFANARRHLNEALAKEPDNRFVVDLWATIAGHLNDRDEANKALERLKIVDDPMFYFFRRSRIEWLFGDSEKALASVREAMAQDGRPSFQVLAQLALCELVAGSQEEAGRIVDRLEKDFSSVRRDVRIGLRTRILLAQGDADAALEMLESMQDKSVASYKSIKRDVLQSLVSSGEQQHRLAELEALAGQVTAALPDFIEIDVN